ncbi:MAG TPA: Ni,Fe-hydrogenase I large subunit, partial [Candidatus Omnitrophota bacterium]|nr:Ni,Fe-hydrogenase I large subunit [Candidatus Omnitrophota bacterium]
MFADARIDVALRVAGGRVAEVRLRSTRLVQASRLFAGRRPDEVATLLPTVFALCGQAQRVACLQAVEAAADAPSPDRRAAVLAETVSEHGLAIARDWPELVGEAPDLAAAKALRLALLKKPDVAATHTAVTILLGAEPEAVLDDFQGWVASRRSPAARLFADLVMERLAGFGACDFRPMPAGGPAGLAARLEEDDGSFVARPDGGFETGPLARHAGHPLVAELMTEHGNGLLPRLTARLVEIASALRELDQLGQDLHEAPIPVADGAGLGMVEAARGLLAHRVEMK